MELTWLALASLLFVGVGYVFVQRAPRPRFVRWGLLCTSLFALATRDLFRPRERGPPAAEATEETEMPPPDAPETPAPDAPETPAPDAPETPPPDAPTNLPDRTDSNLSDRDERRRKPLFGRLRSRVAGWFD